MTAQQLLSLKHSIWPADAVRPVRIYAVLDCARDPVIFDLAARSYREKSSLFAGKLDPDLERAAPCLLELQASDGITDEILLRGWENAWCVLLQNEGSFHSVRRHLRALLRVRTEDGRFLLFRFYDPRVLNAFLPTCTGEELAVLFGESITAWLSCSSGPTRLNTFTLQDGELQRSGVPQRSLATTGT